MDKKDDGQEKKMPRKDDGRKVRYERFYEHDFDNAFEVVSKDDSKKDDSKKDDSKK